MTIVRKNRVRIVMNNHKQNGIALFEVLITIVILSISLLSLVKLQTVLVTHLERTTQQLNAQHLAFQILEIYPQFLPEMVPTGWQYQIHTTQAEQNCVIIKVIVQPPLGKQVTQERWFCKT